MMLLGVLVAIAAALMAIGAVARWGKGRRRPLMLHLIWGAVLLYPVVFTVLDARSVYNGPDARLVDDSVIGSVNAAWSAFIFLACALLTVGLAIRAREEVHLRLASRRALLIGLVLYLGTLGALAVVAGSLSRLLGVSLVGAVLVALTVAGEPLTGVLTRAQVASRGLIGGSLAAAVAFPHWAFVPYGHGGREFFGIGSRLIGLTPSPNYLGILAAIGVYTELARARDRGRRANPVWVVLATVTCLWAQSRTAYLVLTLLLVLFAVKSSKNAVLWNRAGLLILTGLFAVSLLAPLAFAFSSVANNETLGALVTGRFGAWDAAIEAWSDHPLVGFGPGAFGESFWSTYGTPDGQTYANAHNAWLDVLAMAGLFGGLGLLAFAVALLSQAASTPTDTRVIAYGALALVVAQMPFGTPFRLVGLSTNLITMAVVLAVVAAPGSRELIRQPSCLMRKRS